MIFAKFVCAICAVFFFIGLLDLYPKWKQGQCPTSFLWSMIVLIVMCVAGIFA